MITCCEKAFSLLTANLDDLDEENQIILFPLKLTSTASSSTLKSRPLSTRKADFVGTSLDSVKSVLPSFVNHLLDSYILNREAFEEEGQKGRTGLDAGGLSAFEWHPFKTCAAFIHSKSALYIHSFPSNAWLPASNTGFRHELLRDATCMDWCRFASATLAVGCSTGVLIWRFANDPKAGLREPLAQGVMPLFTSNPQTHPQPWIQPLQVKGLRNVSCVQWSPCGRWLVAGYRSKASIVVWDTKDWTSNVLTGHPWKVGSKILSFHPDGDWLLQATSGSGIVLWETHTWSMSKLTTNSECTSISWIPNTKIFLFSLAGSSKIHMLQMKTDAPNLDVTNAPSLKLPRLPLSSNSSIPEADSLFKGRDSDAEMAVKKISLDPTGHRLAVTFSTKSSAQDNRVGLFAVAMRPLPELVPIGWVHGSHQDNDDQDETVRLDLPSVSWGKKIKHGAVMGVQWTATQFTHVPLYF